MRTITVRVPRPTAGWAREAEAMRDDLMSNHDIHTLYLLLRRIQTKAARAERGGLLVATLTFEFSVDGAYALWEYLAECDAHRQRLPELLRSIYDRLRDALEDYEEAQRDREERARLRERAAVPDVPVRERWGVGEGGEGDDE